MRRLASFDLERCTLSDAPGSALALMGPAVREGREVGHSNYVKLGCDLTAFAWL
jgi:hypothetical protein